MICFICDFFIDFFDLSANLKFKSSVGYYSLTYKDSEPKVEDNCWDESAQDEQVDCNAELLGMQEGGSEHRVVI